jgi:hypothetical protein
MFWYHLKFSFLIQCIQIYVSGPDGMFRNDTLCHEVKMQKVFPIIFVIQTFHTAISMWWMFAGGKSMYSVHRSPPLPTQFFQRSQELWVDQVSYCGKNFCVKI